MVWGCEHTRGNFADTHFCGMKQRQSTEVIMKIKKKYPVIKRSLKAVLLIAYHSTDVNDSRRE